MRATHFLLTLGLIAGMTCHSHAASFTYRGVLQDEGAPVSGQYQLKLTLYADSIGNDTLAASLILEDVSVRNGTFAVALEFPDLAPYVASGWLAVEVGAGDEGAWWPLSERSEVKLTTDTICPASWALEGNAGTDPFVEFLGTTDAVAFEIRTQNSRHLRIAPSPDLITGEPVTANVILGSRGNSVTNSSIGASISGGGALAGFSAPNLGAGTPNVAAASFSTVGGGLANRAGPSLFGSGGEAATVGGGYNNVASQLGSTVAGGTRNEAISTVATVSGGGNNHAVANAAVVAGGELNFAGGDSSTVSGGRENGAIGVESTIGGGNLNLAEGGASTISGGQSNVSPGDFAAIPGGSSNCAGGTASWTGGTFATVRPAVLDMSSSLSACFFEPVSGDADGDEGSFVWSDAKFVRFRSSGPNQFLVRSEGGVMLQKQTAQSQPRTFFNAVKGPSGLAVATTLPTSAVASFENDSDAFLHVLAPDNVNKGILFSGPGQLGDGGILYDGIADSMIFLTNGGTPRMVLGAGGTLTLSALGSAGSTGLCRNASNQIATCSSSRRYKEDIVDLDLGLDAILALRPVAYRWKADGMADIGFVAEEVAAVDERLVTRNVDGVIEGVRYDRLSAVLANALVSVVVDQQAQHDELNALRESTSQLQETVALLQAQIGRIGAQREATR